MLYYSSSSSSLSYIHARTHSPNLCRRHINAYKHIICPHNRHMHSITHSPISICPFFYLPRFSSSLPLSLPRRPSLSLSLSLSLPLSLLHTNLRIYTYSLTHLHTLTERASISPSKARVCSTLGSLQ